MGQPYPFFKFRNSPTGVYKKKRGHKRSVKVFLKKIERIDALMSVMALSLFINNPGQMLLREELLMKNETVPNQIGKPTDTPTLKWAFELLKRVLKIRIKIRDRIY